MIVEGEGASGIRYTPAMPTYRAPRGTRDLLPDERPAWERLEAIARDLARRYGYASIETPLFELSDVFERGIGAGTDVVEKELFRVSPSRGEGTERWSLRPEATAGIVRAYVQHGLQTWPQPVRVSMLGPMFRYDRPQAGRFRQFWQWDVEAIGDPGPAVDAEIIELGHRFCREAGLPDVEVALNSIGDPACRPAYREALRAHFAPHADRLVGVERERLATNPLRLLDSKDPDIADLIATAPASADHLCAACAAHFAAVRAHLDALDVPYRVEPRLVRGLDYYTRTAFEYYRPGAQGQQSALGGGGRYDGLVELLGGKPTPGIGFALGLDRVVLALAEAGLASPAAAFPTVVVVGADPIDTTSRLRIATELRAAGLAARADLGQRKLGRQLEGAARDGAHFAVIVADEVAHGQVLVRDLPAATQRPVNLIDLARELTRAHGAHRHGTPED
jgi:histidyl-tRNA synthetase